MKKGLIITGISVAAIIGFYMIYRKIQADSQAAAAIDSIVKNPGLSAAEKHALLKKNAGQELTPVEKKIISDRATQGKG